ncbi:MAG TPA: methionine--tRNA ligase [Thermotogota bacterium]|nr:methionine--tRNA ligase [Thermotogota bacterium]
MNGKKYYVTTPIYYVNSEPHIGSAYTTIVADIIARYKRFCNYEVFFLTGTDEHGQKILEASKNQGMDPQTFCDGLAGKFQQLWKDMGLTHDDFLRTTQPRHEKVVQKFIARLEEKGDVYKGMYEGWYCVSCETFLSPDDLVKDGEKKFCPECNKEVHLVKEENYFFRLSKYNDRLLELYRSNPSFVEPDFRRNEMLRLLEGGLKDLSISRTSFSWGIPMSNDPKHVVYVWVDALLNYISALGYDSDDPSLFAKYWPADLHLIGKEINRFHSIIWPAMLMAADLPLPKKVFAHGWLTVNGEKISKSKGNAIDPRILMDAYGRDVIRYYLLRDIQFGKDGDFSEDNLINRVNADLANDLGNLVHRFSAMLAQNFEGILPPLSEPNGNIPDIKLKALVEETRLTYFEKMDGYQFTQTLEKLWELVSYANKYIDLTQPWVLAKDPEQKERLGGVLSNLGETIRNIALFLKPIMPETSAEIFRRLGYSDNEWFETNSLDIGWGKLRAGNHVSLKEPLFPRIDTKTFQKVIGSTPLPPLAGEKKVAHEPEQPEPNVLQIDFALLQQVQLKVALIVEAEKVPRSKKLVKLQLDVGEAEPRQIVAGISQYYSPEELVGKRIVIVANLKPAKLMGIASNGMLLAAKDGTNLALLTVDQPVEPGAHIS